MRVIADSFLMGRIKWVELSAAHKFNASEIIERVNRLLYYYEQSSPTFQTKLNDGYRLADSPYGSKNSKHKSGQAIDMDDSAEGDFWKWLKNNLHLLKEIGLWIEHPSWTHHSKGSWIHFQSVPPQSGRRIFVPDSSANPNPSFWDGYYDSKLDEV